MTRAEFDRQSQFVGCLLGLALGDALGAPFEGRPTDVVRRTLGNSATIWDRLPPGALTYTDDTQMAIGIVETLIECGGIQQETLCRHFADNYRPQRGYGAGAKKILQAILDGEDHRHLAKNLFPGGSIGNGAAMRVAPLGLFFADDYDRLWQQARESALPTHTHPGAIEGAQLMALAIALAAGERPLEREAYFASLIARCETAAYAGALRRASQISDPRDLCLFGNGVDAASSVVTAIACFALTPESFEDTVANAILQGGDTDTLAAMAGAICGAHLSAKALPEALLARLEDGHQGRTFLVELAVQLSCATPRVSSN